MLRGFSLGVVCWEPDTRWGVGGLEERAGPWGMRGATRQTTAVTQREPRGEEGHRGACHAWPFLSRHVLERQMDRQR